MTTISFITMNLIIILYVCLHPKIEIHMRKATFESQEIASSANVLRRLERERAIAVTFVQCQATSNLKSFPISSTINISGYDEEDSLHCSLLRCNKVCQQNCASPAEALTLVATDWARLINHILLYTTKHRH